MRITKEHKWAISKRAGNLERIFEAAGQRSVEEFRQAMKIIRGMGTPGGRK